MQQGPPQPSTVDSDGDVQESRRSSLLHVSLRAAPCVQRARRIQEITDGHHHALTARLRGLARPVLPRQTWICRGRAHTQLRLARPRAADIRRPG